MPGWGMRIKRGGVEEINQFTNMGRIVRRIQTGGNNGSVTDDGFLTGTLDFQCVVLGEMFFAPPNVTQSGNVVSWSYSGGSGADCVIVVWVS